MTSEQSISISQDDLGVLSAWIADHQSEVPPIVATAILQFSALSMALLTSQQKLRHSLLQLRRALGINVQSERRASGRTTPRRKKTKQDYGEMADDSARLAAWHREQARKQTKKSKEYRHKMIHAEDIELTPEEIAESRAEARALIDRLKLSSGEGDPKFEGPHEAFMVGIAATVVESESAVSVTKEALAERKVIKRFYEQRDRYGFDIKVDKITVDVEKVVVRSPDGGTSVISASLQDIGPPRYDVTWEFLVNMMIMVAQYAIPFNRLAAMISTENKAFTSGMLSKQFVYAAKKLVPLYLQTFRELSGAAILQGDDTSVRVTELTKYYKEKKKGEDISPPWAQYADQDKAKQYIARNLRCPLGVTIGATLPFVYPRRIDQSAKESLHTTVLSGRQVGDDPSSLVVFYRSHLGGLGNLLEELLKMRHANLATEITVQSDLSTVNLIADQNINRRFRIDYAGCASHARRPFALYEADDPVDCERMLHMFKGPYMHEHLLDRFGRTEQSVNAVRQNDSRRDWNEIRDIARDMSTRWSSKTKLGSACQYIEKNFQKLTKYLDNPLLSLTNDFSERMLRLEKMIEASALFRTSLEGRFALDVVRTMVQTAIASSLDPKDYLLRVLKIDDAEIEKNPHLYTPRKLSIN